MPTKEQKMFNRVTAQIIKDANTQKQNSYTRPNDKPLVLEHPAMDAALMYAQPGSIVAKVMAPAMAKGMIESISSGDLDLLPMLMVPQASAIAPLKSTQRALQKEIAANKNALPRPVNTNKAYYEAPKLNKGVTLSLEDEVMARPSDYVQENVIDPTKAPLSPKYVDASNPMLFNRDVLLNQAVQRATDIHNNPNTLGASLQRAIASGDESAKQFAQFLVDVKEGNYPLETELANYAREGAWPWGTTMLNDVFREKSAKNGKPIQRIVGNRGIKPNMQKLSGDQLMQYLIDTNVDPNYISKYGATYLTNGILTSGYYAGADKATMLKALPEMMNRENFDSKTVEKVKKITKDLNEKLSRDNGSKYDKGQFLHDYSTDFKEQAIIDAAYEDLNDILGRKNLAGVIQGSTNKLGMTWRSDAGGRRYNEIGSGGDRASKASLRWNLFGGSTSPIMVDYDELAKQLYERKNKVYPSSAGRDGRATKAIINNIKDGANVSENDIIVLPNFLNIHTLKQGGFLPRNKKTSFEEYYQTVPAEKNDTTSYNLRRAFELAPDEELRDFVKNPNAHLSSVYFNKETGEYEFMKRKDHPTVQLELDWYNSSKAKNFRKQYQLDTSGDYYKYIPK